MDIVLLIIWFIAGILVIARGEATIKQYVLLWICFLLELIKNIIITGV